MGMVVPKMNGPWDISKDGPKKKKVMFHNSPCFRKTFAKLNASLMVIKLVAFLRRSGTKTTFLFRGLVSFQRHPCQHVKIYEDPCTVSMC